MLGRFLHRLRRNQDGATIVEFAFVAPVFVVLIMGLFDLAHTGYTNSLLQGSMQRAGRASTLENVASRNNSTEAAVREQLQNIIPGGTITFTRRAYFDFEDVGQPEEFDDLNTDGVCNNNEPFEDDNGNGSWDADKGEASFGGARDAVLLTADISYPRLFPMAELIGLDRTVNLQASTVLRNQPYDTQDITVEVRNCE